MTMGRTELGLTRQLAARAGSDRNPCCLRPVGVSYMSEADKPISERFPSHAGAEADDTANMLEESKSAAFEQMKTAFNRQAK